MIWYYSRRSVSQITPDQHRFVEHISKSISSHRPIHVQAAYDRLVGGEFDPPVFLASIKPGEGSATCRLTLNGHMDMAVNAVAISPVSGRYVHAIQLKLLSATRMVVTGGFDTTLKIWSSESGQELSTLAGHDKDVLSVTISPDGNFILSTGRDQRAIVLLSSEQSTVTHYFT